MAGLTQPLEFRRHLLCAPKPGFDVIPYIDAFLIALFVALNASVFVMAPGTAVQLPASAAMEPAQTLPTAVLTVDRNELYFFEGRKLAALSLQDRLEEFIRRSEEESGGEGAVLLLKADSTITSKVLFNLMDIARDAGFTQVHLAAEPRSGEDSPWNEGSSDSGS
jgi:biopolymer transport protein ExbD